jgi:hypothetical protein
LIRGRSGGSVDRSWLVEYESKGEVGNKVDGNWSTYRRKRMMVDTQYAR